MNLLMSASNGSGAALICPQHKEEKSCSFSLAGFVSFSPSSEPHFIKKKKKTLFAASAGNFSPRPKPAPLYFADTWRETLQPVFNPE